MQDKIHEIMQDRMKREQADRLHSYQVLNRIAKKGQILFTGSSLMEQFPVQEMVLPLHLDHLVYNRGIGGTTTDDFLREIDTVLLDPEPSRVFLNIGTNDMTDRIYGDKWMEHLMENYEKILQIAKEKLPNTEFYLMAYYPTNQHLPNAPEWSRDMLRERSIANIAACNERVAALAEKYRYHYIDCNAGLTDENGEQKAEFSIDGVHMRTEAYELVFENLKQYL